MQVYLDGRFLDREHALVSVDDRGFLFGDGIYEVTRAHEGRLFEPARHLRRLAWGLDAIGIARPPALDDAALLTIAQHLLAANGHDRGDATVYMQLTRGVAPRVHHFPAAGVVPTVFVSTSALAAPHDRRSGGARVILVDDLRWARCDIKSINLLPNVLGKQQAVAAGAYECLFARDGIVTEGASTNVFAVIDDVLRTHPADSRILHGITRQLVLELARDLGIAVLEEAFTVHELMHAREAMLTSTMNDVMPLVQVEGTWIGDGSPGPVSRRLYQELRTRL